MVSGQSGRKPRMLMALMVVDVTVVDAGIPLPVTVCPIVIPVVFETAKTVLLPEIVLPVTKFVADVGNHAIRRMPITKSFTKLRTVPGVVANMLCVIVHPVTPRISFILLCTACTKSEIPNMAVPVHTLPVVGQFKVTGSSRLFSMEMYMSWSVVAYGRRVFAT